MSLDINRLKAICLSIGITLLLAYSPAQAQRRGPQPKPTPKFNSSTFSGLKFRSVGPALTSGRIADVAVNPNNSNEYFVAAASGGVWKTSNSGNTFVPVFDKQGSYSIGCVSIDPSNTNIVWVGTGENNNQRSVAYGDGVYKSQDGGKSWKNMGLKMSEHIGKILIHPTNSNIVLVSSMGPLWNEGGDRGIYKTIDGGKSWSHVLDIDVHTGVADMVMDPRDPNVIYAASQQRRRHVFTYIGGGPGSDVYKSTDGGDTWSKSNKGLPSVDKGRIGLALSPANPDVLYAIVEASDGKGGFYRSTNRGVNWSKQNKYSTSGNYYQEIYCDPLDENKVFIMDTWLHHTIDGGKTIVKTGEKSKHVDNHTMWIDPKNTDHWLVGCDGGMYETWDHAKSWHYKPNLPITQFYKVSVDNAEPFYNIYGGTQDNNTQGGPSRTINEHGISNFDWYITNGGDGFETAIDPKDENIIYSQSQYGWLVRFDKKSGEKTSIKPQHKKGEPALRWNWDAPLIISPHNNKTLYFAANKVFRSNDRGNSWDEISPDLTRQLDRNKMQVMDRVWGIDGVEKNKSTTIFGNIVAMDESPVKQDLLYIGTDDGLIQVTEDNGQNWRTISEISGIPELTYVNALVCSQHDSNVVYAAFNNHKQGDFKPYIARSSDKGKTWKLIQSNLPERGSVYDLAEDHVNPNLLFAGTEFGAFFSIDQGLSWNQLKSGLPTVAVRDLEIQKRENDLVLGTFGRSFYVLDDYSPLRHFTASDTAKSAIIYPIKTAWMFHQARPFGGPGKAAQGESFFTTPNPKIGVVFTYMIGEKFETIKQKRQKEEKTIKKEGGDVFYPSANQIRDEDRENKPYLLFVIKDVNGSEVRKLKTSTSSGMKRITWDFRYPASNPIRLKQVTPGRYSSSPAGPMALPGTYSVTLYKVVDGIPTQMHGAQSFEIQALNNTTLPATDVAAALDFKSKAADLHRAAQGTGRVKYDVDNRLKYVLVAIQSTPNISLALLTRVRALELELNEISVIMWGDGSLAKREFETPNSLSGRIGTTVYSTKNNSSQITQTNKRLYEEAAEEFETILDRMKKVLIEIESLEAELDKSKAPYTPGRSLLPDWKRE
jgi:photosystem II stability/assembly factor-like uncharacterized protein